MGETDCLCAARGGGMEGALLSFGDLWKRSTSRSSTSTWKILDDGIMPARFLCLSGFRIRSTVAEAQETLTVECTCLLLVSPLAVLSPHEYPAGGWGKGRWRGCQRDFRDRAEDGGDQTKHGRERGALAHYMTGRCKQVSQSFHWQQAGRILCLQPAPIPCGGMESYGCVFYPYPRFPQAEAQQLSASQSWKQRRQGWGLSRGERYPAERLLLMGELLRCSHCITRAAAQLCACFLATFFFPLFCPFHCNAWVGKAAQGPASVRLKWDICLKWEGFQKNLIKKKYQTHAMFLILSITSSAPSVFSVSWGSTGIDIVGQKLVIPPLC